MLSRNVWIIVKKLAMYILENWWCRIERNTTQSYIYLDLAVVKTIRLRKWVNHLPHIGQQKNWEQQPSHTSHLRRNEEEWRITPHTNAGRTAVSHLTHTKVTPHTLLLKVEKSRLTKYTTELTRLPFCKLARSLTTHCLACPMITEWRPKQSTGRQNKSPWGRQEIGAMNNILTPCTSALWQALHTVA